MTKTCPECGLSLQGRDNEADTCSDCLLGLTDECYNTIQPMKEKDVNINKNYLVAFLTGKAKDNLKEGFMVFNDLEKAQEAYELLTYWEECYSCNICKVIKSSDF